MVIDDGIECGSLGLRVSLGCNWAQATTDSAFKGCLELARAEVDEAGTRSNGSITLKGDARAR